MLRAPQLPLALPHVASYGRDDFMLGPSNEVALKLIESWPAWPSPVVLLAGPSGSGKTHLVNIWASIADAQIMDAGKLARLIHPTVSARGAIAIEDVATAPGGELDFTVVFDNPSDAPLVGIDVADPGKWTARYDNTNYFPVSMELIAYNQVRFVCLSAGDDAGASEIGYLNDPTDIADSSGRQLAAFDGFPIP